MSLTEKNLHVIFEEPPSLYVIVSFGEHFLFLLLIPEEIRAKPKLKKPPLCEKYPNTEFFLVRVLPYLDRIQSFTK